MNATRVLNAKEAIAKHVNWKLVLQFAIAVEEQLTAEQVSAIEHHRECAIGRWLDSPVNFKMRQHPAYCDVVTRHIRFHQEMISISQLIAANRFFEAAASIKQNSSFTRAGLAFARAITALDQVAKIAVPL